MSRISALSGEEDLDGGQGRSRDSQRRVRSPGVLAALLAGVLGLLSASASGLDRLQRP